MSRALHDSRVLLWLWLRLFSRRGLRRYAGGSRAGGAARQVLTMAVMAVVVAGISIPVADGLTAYVGTTATRAVLAAVLLPGLTGISILLVFYALSALAVELTGDADLELLLLSPISPSLVIGWRLLEVSAGFTGYLLVPVPGLLIVASRLDLGPAVDVTVVAGALLAPVVPCSLATLLLLLVLRWVPAARVRAVTAALGTLLGIGLYLGSQILARNVAVRGDAPPLPTLPAWVPLTWLGRTLSAAVLGDWQSVMGWAVATLALTAGVFTLAVQATGALFAIGWAGYAEVGRQARKQVVESPPAARFEPVRLESRQTGGSVRALLWKDWTVLRRDPQRLALLVFPLAVVVVSSYRTVSQVNQGHAASLFGGAMYLAFFAAILLTEAVVPAMVNGEGRSLYLLGLAPISATRILAAKWIAVAVPVMVLAEGLLSVLALVGRLSAGSLLLAAVALAAFVITASGVDLLCTLVWPRFTGEGGRRQGTWQALLASFVCMIVLAAIMYGILTAAIASWSVMPEVGALIEVSGLVFGALVCLICRSLGSSLLSQVLRGERGAV